MKLRTTIAAMFLALGATSALQAEMLRFKATLAGTNEVPANASNAMGRAEVWYDTSSGNYSAYVTVSGLSAALTGSHIHEAAAGSNGPVTVNFGGAASYVAAANGFYAGKFGGTYSGNLSKLLSGQAYVNVHSSLIPSGEIRGQLMRVQEGGVALINSSSRGNIDNTKGREATIIQGFVVDGWKRILVRGLGGGLADFGVKNPMPDVALELFDSMGHRVAMNDDWKTTQHAAIVASGFMPHHDKDSAIVKHLGPGAYSAQVVSEKGSGVALVEIYSLPDEPLVTVLQRAGKFNTLIAAATAAGLVDVLSGPGPFTLMAPTDEAFAKLPAGTVESLLLPENKGQLTSILLYHLFPGAVPSSALSATPINAASLQGATVKLVVESAAMANDAKIIETDIGVSNGVIHVIDSVLLPPSG